MLSRRTPLYVPHQTVEAKNIERADIFHRAQSNRLITVVVATCNNYKRVYGRVVQFGAPFFSLQKSGNEQYSARVVRSHVNCHLRCFVQLHTCIRGFGFSFNYIYEMPGKSDRDRYYRIREEMCRLILHVNQSKMAIRECSGLEAVYLHTHSYDTPIDEFTTNYDSRD